MTFSIQKISGKNERKALANDLADTLRFQPMIHVMLHLTCAHDVHALTYKLKVRRNTVNLEKVLRLGTRKQKIPKRSGFSFRA